MKKILLIISASLLTLSCKKEAKKVENSTESIHLVEEDFTNKNIFDWDGSYVGILPCDSCKGINTEIILNIDHTYSLSKLFMDSDKKETTEQGSFIWLEDGCTIALDDKNKTKLKVIEDALIILDNNGQEFTEQKDKNYTLDKNVCQEKDFEEFSYVSDKGKNFKITFGKSCDGIFSEIKSEDFSEYLLRTTASKNETTYENKNNYRLIDKENIVIVYTPRQTITLKQKKELH